MQFTDYQCEFCQRFHQQTFQDLKKHYIESGKVRFYSMDLPLDIHQNALLAAQAGRCAGEQGQFWAMHDRMQANPERTGHDLSSVPNQVSKATNRVGWCAGLKKAERLNFSGKIVRFGPVWPTCQAVENPAESSKQSKFDRRRFDPWKAPVWPSRRS
ncbi:MAG: DsbA family protein [Terriglobia bacterium]